MANGSPAAGSSRLTTVFFIVCFAGVIYFLYRILVPFFSVLVWATVLDVVFLPVFHRVLGRVRGRRTAAAFITCMLVLLLIVLPVTFIGVLVTQQSIALYQSIQGNPQFLGDVMAKLQELESRPAAQWVVLHLQKVPGAGGFDLQQHLREAASSVSRFLVDRGPSLLKNVGGMIFSFFLIFITMFFLLRDGAALMQVVRASSPLPEAYEAELIKKFQDVSYAAFFGSLLTAVVQGAAACLLFLMMGLPAPLFWGAIVSLVSLVPIVGAFLVWLPWAAYLLLAGQTARGIILLALGGLVVSSIDNVLKPMIIRGRTDMHPLLVFLSVIGGLQAFGFLGILLGPLVVALFISFLNFYRLEFRDTLRNKAARG
jgi:predicted PurR-regulated permease PerM